MQDPREPNQFDFQMMDDSPLNTGNGYNLDEDDLIIKFDDEPFDDQNYE